MNRKWFRFLIVLSFPIFLGSTSAASHPARLSPSLPRSVETAATSLEDPCTTQMVVFPLAISADGRDIAFDSVDIADNDSNGLLDIVVHDRTTVQTTVASKPSGVAQSNASSVYSSISADGRFVVFSSGATNLVANDTNGKLDIFVHDRQTNQTTRVSVASGGAQGNGDSNGAGGISTDGRYVVFNSSATNLVADDTNASEDVFVHDRQTGTTTRVSKSTSGIQENGNSTYLPSISNDGRYIVFSSDATNLVDNDINENTDIFVFDRQINATTRVSVASNGAQGNGYSYWPSISADGFYVSFRSSATNLVPNDTNAAADIFVHDRHTAQTTRVSVGPGGIQSNGVSGFSSISADGRYVAFDSNATNLVTGDTNDYSDIFVHDRQTNQTDRISVSSENIQSNCYSQLPSISQDGRFVAYKSEATNLAPGDIDTWDDPYVYDRQTGKTTRVSIESKRPWTLMFYLAGDNDLDKYYPPIFNQLESAANNSNVHTIALWDRMGDANSTYYKILYNTDINNLATYTNDVNSWPRGEVNMGASNTLSDFITWASMNYPAQHYALILSNHGTGLRGGMVDATSSSDLLEIKELSAAISSATSGDLSKLDVLYMDACSMGMIEDAYEVRFDIDFYVASENPQGAFDTPYSRYISGITTATTPQELAFLFTNVYADVGDARNFPNTMSAANVTKLPALVAAINSLAQAINNLLPVHVDQIITVDGNVQRFEMNGDYRINSSDSYIDIYDFARLVNVNVTDTAAQTAAKAVMDAVNEYVITERHHSGTYKGNTWNLDNSHGVSIFFPNMRSGFYTPVNFEFATGTVWNNPLNEPKVAAADTVYWGPMLVNFFEITQPGGPNNPVPPSPLPKLEIPFWQYLPFIQH